MRVLESQLCGLLRRPVECSGACRIDQINSLTCTRTSRTTYDCMLSLSLSLSLPPPLSLAPTLSLSGTGPVASSVVARPTCVRRASSAPLHASALLGCAPVSAVCASVALRSAVPTD